MDNERKSKGMLRFLLVLTFTWTALNIIAYSSMAMMLPAFKETYNSTPGLFPEEMKTMMDMFLALPRSYFAVGTLLFALEMTGGVLMWRLRPAGFHCYTIARLLMLLVPVLFIGRDYLMLGDAMFAALYITAYWLLMKSNGVFKGEKNQSEQ